MNNIYGLFSIANEYAQPSNNLVAWWSSAPSVEQLRKVVASEKTYLSEEDLVKLAFGMEVRDASLTWYRLSIVGESE